MRLIANQLGRLISSVGVRALVNTQRSSTYSSYSIEGLMVVPVNQPFIFGKVPK